MTIDWQQFTLGRPQWRSTAGLGIGAVHPGQWPHSGYQRYFWWLAAATRGDLAWRVFFLLGLLAAPLTLGLLARTVDPGPAGPRGCNWPRPH